MSSTDLTGVAEAASRIQIDGPGAAPTGRIELTEETLTTILPGELDSAVGSQPQPEAPAEERRDGAITIDLDADDVAGQIKDAAEEVIRRVNPDALFDAEAYDSRVRVDGQPTDTLVISVTGSVKYDASDPDGHELFEALRLGKFVAIACRGFISSRQGQYKEDAEGDSVVTGKTVVKITEIVLQRPEDLT